MSISALLNRVAILYEGVSVITTIDGKIKYDVSLSFPYPAKETLSESSLAYGFFADKYVDLDIDKETDTKYISGMVPASVWVKGAEENKLLKEQTIYMTQFNRTITLLLLMDSPDLPD